MNDQPSIETEIALLQQEVASLKEELKEYEIYTENFITNSTNWKNDIDNRLRVGKGIVLGILLAIGTVGSLTFNSIREFILKHFIQ